MLTSVRGIELRQVADPAIAFPADAVATVTASCVCGSDLHGYRGHAATAFPRRIGHEFIGVVSETGSGVTTDAVGDLIPAARVAGRNIGLRGGVAPVRPGAAAGGRGRGLPRHGRATRHQGSPATLSHRRIRPYLRA
jgi:NADPH:quinone reductase-like Zn-dependent oxidoreductase